MKKSNYRSAFLLSFGTLLGGLATNAMNANEDASWLEEKKEILRYLSLVETDAGIEGMVKTIRITGANLQIVNGLGATNGNPHLIDAHEDDETHTNGAGNLIVGYNEDLSLDGILTPSPNRSGSHNIVAGIGNSYASFGGVVFGQECRTTSAYSTVLGGRYNRASALFSTVAGGGGIGFGVGNLALAEYATVVGGRANRVSGQFASIFGGKDNRSEQNSSVVVGGIGNTAAGFGAVVCGGSDNVADGPTSKVSGGVGNTASGFDSAISGGANRVVSGFEDWRAGTLFEDH